IAASSTPDLARGRKCRFRGLNVIGALVLLGGRKPFLPNQREERSMNTSWVKPGLWGVAIGAVATAAIGFSVGGWVTGGTAEKLANARADDAVIAVMTPVCIDRFQHDADVASNLAN